MKRIIIPLLAVYVVLSGLGLFLHHGLSSGYFIYWTAGFAFLFLTVSYSALFHKESTSRLSFFVLSIISINFFAQLTGGIYSPVLPLYALSLAFAAFLHRRWAYLLAAIIVAIEASNLFFLGNSSTAQWQVFGGYAFTFCTLAAIVSYFSDRIQREIKLVRENHEKLLSDAKAVDPLAGGASVEALSDKRRQATYINVARGREGAFGALFDIIALLVPAHTYAVFLDDHGDGVFALRGIRSASQGAIPANVEALKGTGLIGICAAQNQPQYLPDMVIPSKSLGYYAEHVSINSFLALPIRQDESVVGVFVLDSLEANAFPADVQERIIRFVPFFRQIMENIRISLENDIRARNFEALHAMSSILSSSLEIHEVLDNLTPQIRSVVPFDFCAFLVNDERSGETIITSLSGFDPSHVGARFPLEQSAILSHLYKQWRDSRTIGIHHDPDLGERGRDIGLFPIKELQQPIKTLFIKPLIAGDKCIGAAIFSSIRSHAFTEYHRNFMDTLMNQVSMVVDNSLLHRSMRDMARTDGLTGLLNHRTFMEKLNEEYKRLEREPRPFSILLVDIDFFKKVNDSYGHPAGDVALARVAGVLKEVARGSDFVARYGGEEFAVGMVDTEARGAHQLAERLRKIVESTTITTAGGRISFKLTLSIGIASFPVDTRTLDDLLSLSDLSLYHAKRSGRNRVCLYKEVNEASRVQHAEKQI